MAAYTPTVWVNNTAPALSAANLDKLTNELEAQAAQVGLSHSLPDWTDGAPPAITEAAPLNEMERVLQLVAQSESLSYTKTVWENGWTPARNAARFNQMEQQAVVNRQNLDSTPGSGILQWPLPPGWNGGDPRLRTSFPSYSYIEIGGSQRITQVNMTNGVDYFIKFTAPVTYTTSTSDPDDFASIRLNGGRHCVIVGGDVRIDSGAPSGGRQTEPLGFLIDGGTDGGIIHLEGLYIRANNPVTMRSRRTLQIQYCVLEAQGYRPAGDPAHSDLVQMWATNYSQGPCQAVRMHYVSCTTDFTGLSNLTQLTPNPRIQANIINPITWHAYKVDIHPRMIGSLGEAGNFFYQCDSETGGNGPGWQNFGPYTAFHREVYCELPQGGGGAYLRGIDDISALRSLDGGTWVFPYEIKNSAGVNQYTSPAEPTGGSGHASAKVVGNYMTFDRVAPLSDQKLYIGQPPQESSTVQGTGVSGQVRRVFVPTANVGMGYVPKGYL